MAPDGIVVWSHQLVVTGQVQGYTPCQSRQRRRRRRGRPPKRWAEHCVADSTTPDPLLFLSHIVAVPWLLSLSSLSELPSYLEISCLSTRKRGVQYVPGWQRLRRDTRRSGGTWHKSGILLCATFFMFLHTQASHSALVYIAWPVPSVRRRDAQLSVHPGPPRSPFTAATPHASLP